MQSLPIAGTTRIVCVIGDPIAHSLSPAMHNAALQHAKLNMVYVAFRVAPTELRHALVGMRALDILGMNVTVPHKEHIVRYLDQLSPRVKATGAANTVVNRKGKLYGENTDVLGFERAIAETGIDLSRRKVLVIGAGGAARAVITALKEAGVRSVVIANRTRPRAARLAKVFGCTSKFSCTTASLGQLHDPEITSDTDLVVNCTSIGLLGESFLPISYEQFPKDCAFYDLIPRGHTDFIAQAHHFKRRAYHGLGMLLHQGAAAFELWTGEDAPVDVMRRALDRAFGRAYRH